MSKLVKSSLRNHIDFLTGFPFKSQGYSQNSTDIKLMCGDNIGQGFVRWDTVKRWPSSDAEEYERYLLEENDVVLAMDRPWIDAGLKYATVSRDDLPSLLLQRTARLRGTPTLDVQYLKYIIGSPWFTEYVKRINTGSLVPHISGDQIKEFAFPIPSIDHQKTVAEVLGRIDKKIELNNKINAELEAMAKLIYDYWFVQFDFPDANGKPYKSSGGKMVYNPTLKRDIPEGWGVRSLLDIATFTNGIACQKYRPAENEASFRVIKIREMGDGFTNDSESVSQNIPEKVVVRNGDVLFSWSASLDVMIWAGGIGGLNQHIFKVTSDKYPRTYYYFEILRYLEYFKMVANLRKTTMGHITREHLQQSRLCVPPKELIEILHEKIDPVLERIVKSSEENMRLASLRDWLLPMLMNGQVTVKPSDSAN